MHGKIEKLIFIICILKIPELSRTFTMELANVSGGRINETYRHLPIIIQPSDHPYGLFVFKEIVIRVDEDDDDGVATLTITRFVFVFFVFFFCFFCG